ncbi:MAG: hypothetical protein AB7I27_14895 [Bacteriovoracaceae bacterium]
MTAQAMGVSASSFTSKKFSISHKKFWGGSDEIYAYLVARYGIERLPSEKDFKELLELWNPQVKDVEHFPPGTKIYFKLLKVRRRLKLSAVYFSQVSRYSEKLSENTGNVKNDRTSFFTLGLEARYRFWGTREFIRSQFYWSYINAAKLNGNQDSQKNLSIPPELGLGLYYDYFDKKFSDFVFAGLDLESFSSFNKDRFFANSNSFLDQNTIYYGTIGAGITQKLKASIASFRLSYSHSMYSTTDSTDHADTFSGSRYMLQSIYKPDIFSKYSWRFNLKYVELSGPSHLTLLQLGLGVGYRFY